MKRSIHLYSICILLGCLLTAISGCKKTDQSSPSTSDTIVIGEVGSMTGNEASFGISTHQGIELAFKEVNAAGGVLGKKLELRLLDNQGKPDEAATAVTRLITQDKAIAILGEVASSRSLAMAPIAQSYKIPMISPSSTNPKVTEQGDFIFRVCFIDPFQGKVMAKFARENLNITKVAVIRDVKNDYSIGLADFFIEDFKARGGEILIDQSYSSGDTDFKAQLTTVKSKNPEAIFIPGFYADVALIARQSREVGIKVPLLGGDGWDSQKLFEIGGKSLEGSYFSTHYSPDDTSPRIQEFIKKFKNDYQTIPDSMAAMGYDAALVLVDSIKRANSLDPVKIRDAIAQTKDFPGVTGNITIDDKRNAQKPATILKIEGGAQHYSTTINP